MKYLVWILLIAQNYSLFAQHIVWESEYLFEDPTVNSFCPIIKDSDNNYVITIDDCASPYVQSYFLKYDSSGAVLNYNQYFNGNCLVPFYLTETDFGYRMIAATNYTPVSRTGGLFPIIINTNKEGDTINLIEQYDKYEIYNDTLPRFFVPSTENAFYCINNLFYNAGIKTKIISEDSVFHSLHHLIINCFDSTGKVFWRKGYDTLGYGSDYYFADFKLSADSSSLLTLVIFAEYGTQYKQMILYKMDLFGNMQDKYIYSDPTRSYTAIDMVSLEGDTIILLWRDAQYNYYLWKINPLGEVILEKQIALPLHINDLLLSPNGSIYTYGTLLIDRATPDYDWDDIFDMYLCKINQDLEIDWEYTWNRHVYQDVSAVSDILFLDDNNFILSGHKDWFKHYLAKFSEEPEGVAIQETNNNILMNIYPNPVTDLCEIKLNNIQALNLEIAIYDIFGNKVKDVSNEPALAPQKSFIVNLSGLAPGSYFVSVNAGGKMIRKKILKI